MARQAERREATRGAILVAARALFGRAGFGATGVDRIAAEAGVAKGAVYHHFPTKEAIFEAVLEAVTAEVAGDVREASRRAPDVLATLTEASRAYVSATARPAIRRILLQDGPAVLGWERWREIDLRHFHGLPRVLEQAMAQGLIAPQPVHPLARVLQGAMTEAAMAAASGTADGEAYLSALATLIDGLRTKPARA
jgi:AcrR family transcriptional regulator